MNKKLKIGLFICSFILIVVLLVVLLYVYWNNLLLKGLNITKPSNQVYLSYNWTVKQYKTPKEFIDYHNKTFKYQIKPNEETITTSPLDVIASSEDLFVGCNNKSVCCYYKDPLLYILHTVRFDLDKKQFVSLGEDKLVPSINIETNSDPLNYLVPFLGFYEPGYDIFKKSKFKLNKKGKIEYLDNHKFNIEYNEEGFISKLVSYDMEYTFSYYIKIESADIYVPKAVKCIRYQSYGEDYMKNRFVSSEDNLSLINNSVVNIDFEKIIQSPNYNVFVDDMRYPQLKGGYLFNKEYKTINNNTKALLKELGFDEVRERNISIFKTISLVIILLILVRFVVLVIRKAKK
ncbi:MAG: hypothetical protein IJS60_05410 [Abditibacteriota bacterium]|nr:hypothetical protein [Abditibacteriota bacterium]